MEQQPKVPELAIRYRFRNTGVAASQPDGEELLADAFELMLVDTHREPTIELGQSLRR